MPRARSAPGSPRAGSRTTTGHRVHPPPEERRHLLRRHAARCGGRRRQPRHLGEGPAQTRASTDRPVPDRQLRPRRGGRRRRTVKVFFKAPTLGFIPTLGYHGSILISPKTLALPAEEQADLSQDIGSGPYVVESWKEGDIVELAKRKDYNWGPAAVGHDRPGLPRHRSPTSWSSEPSLRIASVQSGQADVAYNASPAGAGVPEGRGLHRRDAALPRLRQRLRGQHQRSRRTTT